MKLPNSFLRTRWVDISVLGDIAHVAKEESARAAASPGWNVKVRRLRGDLHLIDVAFVGGDVGSVLVALLRDHPFLGKIPAGAPRATRAIYRKEVRLAHARATDAFPVLAALNLARDAWDKYNLNSKAG